MVGRPISPVFFNILVTSVCDMRCTHCFFTEELDDRPRKKLQMKTDEIAKISETLGGNLGVLVLAGGEPFTRKDLPEIVRAFYENNKLESVYLMSNGQIHQRIFPDVTRIMDECPNLNVTVALGIDGMKDAHEKIRRKEGSWDKAIHTARTLQQMKREQYPQLDIQTCTCVMHSNEDTIFDWYDFLKYDLKPDKVNINYIRPPSADPNELAVRSQALSAAFADDPRGHEECGAQEQLRRRIGLFQGGGRYLHARPHRQDEGREQGPAQMLCRQCRCGDLRQRRAVVV